MRLCYLFSAKTEWQLVNRKADFLQNESIQIANWNALVHALMRPIVTDKGVRRILVRGVNAPLPPRVKKIF